MENRDEKGRAKIERELEQAALRAEVVRVQAHQGAAPHRRVKRGLTSKQAPPGFTPAEIARDAEQVKKFASGYRGA